MKLKYRLFIIFFLISNIPLVIISYFSYNRYTSLLKAQLNQVSQNLLEHAVDTANNTIDDINHITEIFTFYSESYDSIVANLKKYTGDEVYTTYDIFQSNKNIKFICQNLIYSSDYINGIFIFTPSGETLGYGYGDSIDILPGYNPREDEWYQKTIAAEGKIYVDGTTEKDYMINASPSITFSRALYDVYSHGFLGVLIVDCSPDLFNLESVNTMPENVMLSVEGPYNQILYTNATDLPTNFANHSTVVMKENLKLEPLTLSAAINYDALYQEFGASRLVLIAFAIICAVIFLIISIVLSYYVTNPIAFLSNRMSKYKSNDYIKNSKYLERTDEIGILFNEYNSMLHELDSYIKKEYQNKLITLDSQMKSLEAQINSHFLYNTLESINSLAEIEGIETISTMSMALGSMFRYSIKTKSELVTIADEINHVKDYLSIQQIRFSNRFHVDISIPQTLYNTKVLKLILQPIVENAFYHGLNYCTTGNYIQLSAKVVDHLLYIMVSDNGKGMSKEQLHTLKEHLKKPAKFMELGHRNKQSIGLKNIHSRIELYYGQTYGLSIQSKEGQGTVVTIKIPIFQEVNEDVSLYRN